MTKDIGILAATMCQFLLTSETNLSMAAAVNAMEILKPASQKVSTQSKLRSDFHCFCYKTLVATNINSLVPMFCPNFITGQKMIHKCHKQCKLIYAKRHQQKQLQ